MKNSFNNIFSKVASVSAAILFGLTAFAQETGTVVCDKKVTPDPDPNGVYTISLEAYVTGAVTVTTETKPADIILVLDYSQSMENNMEGTSTSVQAQLKRINILRNAVAGFVKTVQDSNTQMLADGGGDDLGGHRIAFVLFHRSIVTGTGRNRFLNVEDLTATEASGSGNSYSQATVNYSNSNIIGANTDYYTYSGDAMERAQSILAGENYSSAPNRTRVVVFFTDGAPYTNNETNWQTNAQQRNEANQCITAANNIKSSTTYGATIYSVGLFNKAEGTADVTTTYLRYVSSDYDEAPQIQNAVPSGGWVPVSGDKSIIVSSASSLENVFSTIATSAGGNYSASSSSSVMIDVVATSFSIPTDADLGSVKVYKVACTVPSADAGQITFDDENPVDITSSVGLTVEGEEVQVTGFDYGAEWCGWDASANDNTGAPHGHKLVLTIPITVNDNAIGGPHVNTNTSDSRLEIRDSDGNLISTQVFPRPYLKLPVSLWIQKTGLLEDDSAVFNLRRTPYLGPDVDYNASSIVWESWGEKIVCNKNTMDENGIVKVTGLHPDYVYKIYEDAWGALGYTYQDDDVLYSVGDNAENPFKFHNTPKNTVFDEATVRNVFKKKEKTTSASTE